MRLVSEVMSPAPHATACVRRSRGHFGFAWLAGQAVANFPAPGQESGDRPMPMSSETSQNWSCSAAVMTCAEACSRSTGAPLWTVRLW